MSDRSEQPQPADAGPVDLKLGLVAGADDLAWHALNYRTAAPQHAEAMWQELRACVERKLAAERERCLNEWNGLLLELRQMADDSADRGDVFAQRVVALLSRA